MYGIKIDAGLNISVTRQICSQIRALIESGELAGGMRLPPTRKIAGELNINRNTLVEVYEQLIAEGYLEGRVGSGTYVSAEIRHASQAGPIAAPSSSFDKFERVKSGILYFETGIPDLAALPLNLWGRYLKQASENSSYLRENYSSILGDADLRSVLSQYIFRVRGIRCSPGQIMIVAGSSGGFLLIAQALSEAFDSIFVEDPTVDFTRDIFRHMNYKINPVEVDRNGMNMPDLNRLENRSLILLTPSHQFPTGSVLPIQRRLQAIKLAEATDSYLIEDDYDSEFRFKGIPIPPLQVLAPSRVIYLGTFSKTLFPGLRLGFIIIPEQLVNVFKEVKSELNMFTSIIEQRALAHFIRDGHLDRHIYKMKNVYKKRRAMLADCLDKYFGKDIAVVGDESGMHVQVEFRKDKFSGIDWNGAVAYGVKVDPVEEYCLIKGNHKNRIVLGYGNIGACDLEEGIKRLHQFILNS
jgi:GntR family transcriptional regulator/MocR family aminotransferase